MKIIRYQIMTEVNRGTEESPIIELIIQTAEIACPTQAAFDANYPIAEKEAVGEIIVEGEFDEEVIEPTQLDRVESQVAYLAMMTGYEEILEV